MKICKVKPDYATCSACVETQQMFDVVDDCSKCKLNTEIYELLQIGQVFGVVIMRWFRKTVRYKKYY